MHHAKEFYIAETASLHSRIPSVCLADCPTRGEIKQNQSLRADLTLNPPKKSVNITLDFISVAASSSSSTARALVIDLVRRLDNLVSRQARLQRPLRW